MHLTSQATPAQRATQLTGHGHLRAFASLAALALLCSAGTAQAQTKAPCVVSDTPVNAGHTIVRIAQLPNNHPKDGEIYMASELNDWTPGNSEYRLKRQCDGTYQIEIPTAKRSRAIDFKFTRGDWNTVERSALGADIDNRTLMVGANRPLASFAVAAWADKGVQTAPLAASVVGDLALHTLKFEDGNRTVRVWLPPNYTSNQSKRYPVLYMFDGQNVFDQRTSGFGNEWQADETLTRLSAEDAQWETIVVAMDHGGEARRSEYTAYDWRIPGGASVRATGAATADWVANTVVPFVDGQYRTLANRDHRGLMGASLGAYMTLYTGMRHQGVFGKLAAVSIVAVDSPLNGQKLRDFIESDKRTDAAATRVYIDIGDSEDLPYTSSEDLLRNHSQMCLSLRKAGYSPRCPIYRGSLLGIHSEVAWSRRFGAIHKHLFGKADAAKPSAQ